jgi:hypothetical protein
MHVILKGDTKPKKIHPKLGKRLVELKLATYETRDIVPAEPEVKPKRQYRRRDMKAEG